MSINLKASSIDDLTAKMEEHRKKIGRKTLTVKELAKVLGISENKARQLTHVEGFPVLVLGQTRLTIISKLDDWLENNFGKIF